MAAHCYIPNKEEIEKHVTKASSYKRTVSTRRADGLRKLDPLTVKRRAFVAATSEFGDDAFNMNSSRDMSANFTIDNQAFEVDGSKSPINIADG